MASVWWHVEGYSKVGRPKRVTFAVEADKAVAALRRVHDLGYIIDFEDNVFVIPFESTFELDYRLPLVCTGGCSLPQAS